ncbi:MAG TPA: SpoIIE family protein phosphatase, partial [Anaerolineaceae bacterium]|nr:SpoIIE family protein phosphatase [Anaerolineaceae bacterium]
DLQTNTIVITRNNPTPVFVAHGEQVECITSESVSIGTNRNIRPSITEFPLESGITIVIYTDGIKFAGERTGQPLDICLLLESMLEEEDPSPQEIADNILAQAIRADNNRPNDDMSVVVLRSMSAASDQIRRMTIRLPVGEGISW